MGRDYTQLAGMTLRLRRIGQEGLRQHGRENAAAPSQVDYIEQELLFIDAAAVIFTVIFTVTELHV